MKTPCILFSTAGSRLLGLYRILLIIFFWIHHCPWSWISCFVLFVALVVVAEGYFSPSFSTCVLCSAMAVPKWSTLCKKIHHDDLQSFFFFLRDHDIFLLIKVFCVLLLDRVARSVLRLKWYCLFLVFKAISTILAANRLQHYLQLL